MNDEMKYKVCINCHTYNHSNYICDALNGFTMQETNFPFIIMLVDDNSTDGEQKVISDYVSDNFEINFELSRETDYATIHFGQHKINRNCYIVIHYLKYNHYQKRKAKDPYLLEWRNNSDYEALCEGDDYWTDPYKLQKQVDFLEANPEYSFCCHRFQIYKEVEKKYIKEYGYKLYKSGQNLIIDEHVFFSAWVTQWLTTMVRTDIYKECFRKSMEMFASGLDVYFYFLLLQRGNGVSLNDYMGVYRWHSKGVSIGRTSVEKVKNGYDVNYNLFSKFPNKPILLVRMKYYAIRLLGYYNCLNKENIDFYKKSMFLWITKKEKVKSFIIFVLPPFIWSFMRDFYGFFIFRK